VTAAVLGQASLSTRVGVGDRTSVVVADSTRSGVRLAEAMSAAHYETWLAEDVDSALCVVSMVQPDWIVLDPWLHEGGNLGIIREFAAEAPRSRVAVTTTQGSVSTALEALQLGAADFFCKPVAAAQVLRSIGAAEPQPNHWLGVDDAMECYIVEIFERCGSLSAAARLLGIDRRSLRRMMTRFEQKREAAPVEDATPLPRRERARR
jgi:two-component system response regulator RegA